MGIIYFVKVKHYQCKQCGHRNKISKVEEGKRKMELKEQIIDDIKNNIILI